MERNLASRGLFLAEQVVAIGLISLLLLVLAAMTVQMGKSGKQTAASYEASCLAQNRLEAVSASAIDALPLGPQPPIRKNLSDGTECVISTELYAVTDPSAAGLTDQQIRRIRVAASWTDSVGQHVRLSEGLISKVPP